MLKNGPEPGYFQLETEERNLAVVGDQGTSPLIA
jgi:hypothetical protein